MSDKNNDSSLWIEDSLQLAAGDFDGRVQVFQYLKDALPGRTP
jgi:hypothetical protein